MRFQLSIPQRQMLIAHMDGQRTPMLHYGRGSQYYHTANSLLTRRFLQIDGRCRPPLLHITDKGLHELARNFAEEIEDLLRVGFQVEDRGNLSASFAQIFHRTQGEHRANKSLTAPLDNAAPARLTTDAGKTIPAETGDQGNEHLPQNRL